MVWQYNSDVLCHWGVKGQKWGVRRYQNRDGTLTPAGKIRYADEKTVPSKSTVQKSSSNEGESKSSTKSISDLSDDELRRIVNRKQTERQLRDLIAAEEKSGQSSTQQVQQRGQGMVSKALKNAGEQALTTMAKGAMLYAGSTFVKTAFKNPELAKAIATGSMGGGQDKKKD